jgi:DNA mismatch repair protein MutL
MDADRSVTNSTVGIMSSIHLLDSVTVGQIAAGEIIERPHSVVKELVENAIDAGAARVSVTLERGGMDLIEVIDDGAGIAPGDLPLAVERHATSKLSSASDLESIATLGFRGEGLASIAAVAALDVRSRTAVAEVGARIVAHAGNAGPVEAFAVPPGTCVRVSELFANVPVRREYLRSPSAEFNRVSSWLSAFALAYPRVTFTLRHDGKDVWVMPATADPRERLAMVFGRDAAAAMIPLESEAARMLDGTLRGFISAPGSDRADRRMQLLFVNGRLLRSTLLVGAWTAGYSTFTMIGRHPYGALMLDLPPHHVDPNVHPTKSDVRLRYGTQVFDAVRRSIAATLRAHASDRLKDAATAISLAPQDFGVSALAEQSLFANRDVADEERETNVRVLAQVHRTFILATDGEGLLLVDQHAAHERIAYEAIVEHARAGDGTAEPLLVPIVVELDEARSAVLDRVIEALRECGLEIEPFGERAYRIGATPLGYRARPFDLAGFLEDLTEDPKQRDARERVWAALACHSVTVAGETLAFDEMVMLLQRLRECANPMHCPHGRPTMVRLDPGDLAKMFKRV